MSYANKAYHPETNKNIYKLHREGVGIRGIARVLGISTATVMTRIKILADIAVHQKHGVIGNHKILEMDEMWTYVGKKENEVWVMYLCGSSSQVITVRTRMW